MSSALYRGLAVATVTVALGGCGGSSKVSRTSPSTSVPNPGAPYPPQSNLPRSANGPITCTVFESAFATQVIFESRQFDVRPECRQWSHGRPEQGYLWGYEATRVVTAGATQACYLANVERNVTARVIEATGFLPVSAAQRSHALSACASILASGWTAVTPAASGRSLSNVPSS